MILPARTELPLLVRTPASFARRYWLPVLLLVICATADAVTTYRNTALYGPDVEVHPVQRILFAVLGAEVGVPLAKVLQVGFVLLVAAWWKPWCGWLMSLCGVLYGLAALSNHNLWL